MTTPLLLLKKVVFGKFSFTYQSMIKSTNNASMHKNYLRPCSKIDPLSHIAKALKSDPQIAVLQSLTQISFSDIDFGAGFQKLRRQKGRFNYYDVEKYNDIVWQRLGFKERIYDHGVRRIYHFLDGEFFFGELFFIDLRKIDYQKIARVLLEKYAGESIVDLEGDFKIVDKDAFIYFENSGINLSIKYISTKNEALNQKLESIAKVSFTNQINQDSELEDLL